VDNSYTYSQMNRFFLIRHIDAFSCSSQAGMLGEVFAVALVALAPFSMMLKLLAKVIFDDR
jgi:hypothetical protein